MRDEKFHATGDHMTALHRRAGCGGAAKGRGGELCSAIDELIAVTPNHYADAAIKFII